MRKGRGRVNAREGRAVRINGRCNDGKKKQQIYEKSTNMCSICIQKRQTSNKNGLFDYETTNGRTVQNVVSTNK